VAVLLRQPQRRFAYLPVSHQIRFGNNETRNSHEVNGGLQMHPLLALELSGPYIHLLLLNLKTIGIFPKHTLSKTNQL
jgi:hypothetical protein